MPTYRNISIKKYFINLTYIITLVKRYRFSNDMFINPINENMLSFDFNQINDTIININVHEEYDRYLGKNKNCLIINRNIPIHVNSFLECLNYLETQRLDYKDLIHIHLDTPIYQYSFITRFDNNNVDSRIDYIAYYKRLNYARLSTFYNNNLHESNKILERIKATAPSSQYYLVGPTYEYRDTLSDAQCLVTGKSKVGENIDDAAKREVAEEVGLYITKFDNFIDYPIRSGNERVYFTNINNCEAYDLAIHGNLKNRNRYDDRQKIGIYVYGTLDDIQIKLNKIKYRCNEYEFNKITKKIQLKNKPEISGITLLPL